MFYVFNDLAVKQYSINKFIEIKKIHRLGILGRDKLTMIKFTRKLKSESESLKLPESR